MVAFANQLLVVKPVLMIELHLYRCFEIFLIIVMTLYELQTHTDDI